MIVYKSILLSIRRKASEPERHCSAPIKWFPRIQCVYFITVQSFSVYFLIIKRLIRNIPNIQWMPDEDRIPPWIDARFSNAGPRFLLPVSVPPALGCLAGLICRPCTAFRKKVKKVYLPRGHYRFPPFFAQLVSPLNYHQRRVRIMRFA